MDEKREVLTDLRSLANLSEPEGFFDLIIQDDPCLASTPAKASPVSPTGRIRMNTVYLYFY
jgi:hypothetical protein